MRPSLTEMNMGRTPLRPAEPSPTYDAPFGSIVDRWIPLRALIGRQVEAGSDSAKGPRD